MAEVTFDGPVNGSQLSYELGGVGVRVVHGDPAEVWADTTEEALLTALEAHVADPGWAHPTFTPGQRPPSVEDRLAELEHEWGQMKARAEAQTVAGDAKKIKDAIVGSS
jgi:hypothetical protein